MRFATVIALLVFLGMRWPSPASNDSPRRTLAFIHVTVIDGTGAPARPDMTVLIQDGRITAVGTSQALAPPAHAQVIDAQGRFLIPGLWDMHVHWYDEASLPLFYANGVTGIRIMCGYPVHLQWRRRSADGTLCCPRLYVAGPIVDGPYPMWPDALRAADREQGRDAVRTIAHAGYDCVKVYDLLPHDAYLGIAAEASRLGLPFLGHVPLAVSAAEASDAGQKTIEHLTGIALACSPLEKQLRREILAALPVKDHPDPAVLRRFQARAEARYDEIKAGALFARFVKNQTWQVPTLVAQQAHAQLADHLAEHSPWVQYLPVAVKQRWDSRRRATFRKLTAEDFAAFRRSFERDLELVRTMHQAGVRFLAGTDTESLDVFPGFSLHEELALLVKAGLSPMEALQTATRNPAECLGRQDELGTVEKDKLADLVLLDANPLDDIHNTRKIHAVVLGGRLLKHADLQVALKQVAASVAHSHGPAPAPGANSKYP